MSSGVCRCMHTDKCVCVHMYTFVFMYICRCIHVYICICICACEWYMQVECICTRVPCGVCILMLNRVSMHKCATISK